MFTPRLLKLKIHSRRVTLFKHLLPICAFLLTGVMIVWPALNEQKNKFIASVPFKGGIKDTKNDMEQVRFFSKDGHQNPFTVVAESVRETDPSRQIVLLDQPKATYHMKNGTLLTGITSFGMAFQKEKYLYFEEKVDMTSTDGYQGVSSKVICEYEAGRLGSDADVYIKGPAGMLTSQGFYAKDNGDYIHFKNHTETLLFHTAKNIADIDSLKFSAMRDYLKQNTQNTFIVSDNGLIINQPLQTITAVKNVKITQGESELTAPKVTLNYRKLKSGDTEVIKVNAETKVKISRPDQNATGDKLTVYKDSSEIKKTIQIQTLLPELKTTRESGQMILLTGNAVLNDKKTNLTADSVTVVYDQAGKEIEKTIADKKAVIRQEEKQASADRVILYKNKTEIQQVIQDQNRLPELKTSHDSAQMTILKGKAFLKDKTQTLKTDYLTVLYDKTGKEIEKIVADGSVFAQQQDKTFSGNRLTVYQNPAEIQTVLKAQSTPRLFHTYTQPAGRFTALTGNAVLKDGLKSLTAQNAYAVYDKSRENITEATAEGNAHVSQPGQTAQGDKISVYKLPEEIKTVLKNLPPIKELNPQNLPGQIVLIEGQAVAYEKPNKITADKLYVFYDSKAETVIKSVAVGNMTVQNETQKIQGEYGVYTTATEVASVYDNVVLTEKDSVLKGSYASLNLKTGVSSLTAPKRTGGQKGRVKGSIVPNNFKGK